MDKWSFNCLLLNRLPDVLDISGAEIARRCGIKQQVFNRYTNNEVVLSVRLLIKICNSLRMPAHLFVSENNNHVIPEHESATVPLDCWQPIEWDMAAVERIFGDGGGRIYWKDVAAAMGVTEQKPHARFRLEKRFPVDAFLATCSRLDVSPFKFLIDRNLNVVGRRTAPHVSGDADLRRQITAVNDAVKDLSAKYEALLERHNRLLERHNELERMFADRSSCGGLLMVSEPDDT